MGVPSIFVLEMLQILGSDAVDGISPAPPGM